MAQKAAAAWRSIQNRSVLALHRKAIEDTTALLEESKR
jgi:hypothetical protein